MRVKARGGWVRRVWDSRDLSKCHSPWQEMVSSLDKNLLRLATTSGLAAVCTMREADEAAAAAVKGNLAMVTAGSQMGATTFFYD